MQPLPLIENMTFRSCGECTACCTALGVHEIEKPEFTRCQHDCGTSCGIYESRPKSCQTYQCLWTAMKSEAVGEEFRPDKLGVIIEITETTVGPAVVAREVIPGCMEDSNSLAAQFAMSVAQKIRGYIVIFKADNKRRSVFPEWASEAARKARILVENWQGEQKPVLREVSVSPAVARQKSDEKKAKERRLKKLAKQARKRNR